MSTAAKALVGKTLAGRFRVLGYLGEGAMAAVYRCEQDEEPKKVALKVMHAHLAMDKTFVKRFHREAKAAARLEHPNTVQIIDCGVDGTVAYIAMELLEGSDLFDALARERRLSETRAVRIVMQTCEALAAAHDEGIVHRDLKPENIMLVPDPIDPTREVVKVLDFGIAKILERAEKGADEPPSSLPNSALTTVGSVIGTPAYMSPEQCRGEAIDGRSDLYACGVLLYQLVAGRTPFVGETPIEVAMAHVREEPPPPSTFAPGLSAGLEQVILKALQKWPAQRQQSALDLRAELAELLPGLSTSTKRSMVSQLPVVHDGHPSIMPSEGSLPGIPRDVVIKSQRHDTEPSREAAKTEPVLPALLTKPAPLRIVRTPLPPAVESAPAADLAARVPAPVYRPSSAEHVVPTWVMLPLGLLVGAVIGVLGFLLLR